MLTGPCTFPALRDYEPRVSLYTDQLMQAIDKELGTPMNVTRWFNYYSFEVMGDLSFGKSFNMLVDGKDSYVLTQLHGDMKNIGLFSHLTWLFPFFKRTPGLNAEYLKFWNWVEGRVKERIQVSRKWCWAKGKGKHIDRNRTRPISRTCSRGFSRRLTRAKRPNRTITISSVMRS